MPPKAAPTPGSQSQLPKPQPSTSKLPELDKSKEALKDLHDSQKNDSMIHDDDAPSGNVREFILKHYGINAAEEKAKKEKRAEKFRMYVQNTGLQVAFQLVISEFLSKNIPKEEAFKFAAKRFKEIGKEYEEIKRQVDDKKAKENLKIAKESQKGKGDAAGAANKSVDKSAKSIDKLPDPKKKK